MVAKGIPPSARQPAHPNTSLARRTAGSGIKLLHAWVGGRRLIHTEPCAYSVDPGTPPRHQSEGCRLRTATSIIHAPFPENATKIPSCPVEPTRPLRELTILKSITPRHVVGSARSPFVSFPVPVPRPWKRSRHHPTIRQEITQLHNTSVPERIRKALPLRSLCKAPFSSALHLATSWLPQSPNFRFVSMLHYTYALASLCDGPFVHPSSLSRITDA